MSEIQGIALQDPAPEEALPLPLPSPPPMPQIPSAQRLQSWLPLYFKKADRTLEHLSKILSTPSGTDTVLLTICFTSLLSSNVLSSISLHRVHNAARQIIEKAISLPPNTTIVVDTSSIPSSRLLINAQRLKKLSGLISEFRMFTRLWGMLGLWKWGKGVIQNPSDDPLLRRIAYGQVFVNVCYQYLENGAYLSSKGILGWSTERQNRAWIVSTRFWMAHVVMDFIRLYHEYSVRKDGIKGAEKDDGVVDQVENAWQAKWKKELVVDLAYAPLTVHWSLEKGLVGEFWVGLLGSVAGAAGLRALWNNTR